jgi:hypothetical protein
VEEANRVVPASGRVIVLTGDESLYLARPRICNSWWDRPALGAMAAQAHDPADLRARFRRRRITHLLAHEHRCAEYAGRGLLDWGDPARTRFRAFMKAYGRRIFEAHGVALYEFSPAPLPHGDLPPCP